MFTVQPVGEISFIIFQKCCIMLVSKVFELSFPSLQKHSPNTVQSLYNALLGVNRNGP